MHWSEKLKKKDKKYLKLLLNNVLHYKNIAKKEDEAMMQIWVCLIRLYEHQIFLERKIKLLAGKKGKRTAEESKPAILKDLMKY
ncbi:MAG: hypothetical protein DRN66_00395 [Candidatus Nanohalarchaeota archaeon]|nr:MAG: hypothetical protein DRN66_00395 [Candidatus Nanohaloarchaeota archaeon]